MSNHTIIQCIHCSQLTLISSYVLLFFCRHMRHVFIMYKYILIDYFPSFNEKNRVIFPLNFFNTMRIEKLIFN